MSYSWGAARVPAGTGGFRAGHRTLGGEHGIPDHRRDGAALGGERPSTERQDAAAQLAPMVGVWQRLLTLHVPDRAGRCRTCTKGGTGLPSTPWPCSIHGIAEMARRHHHGQLAG
ncbi:hypothetical protein [Pseudonocardia nigra]|uniref:hypothetical protein n=1 Tax=Pseudonocardia nigra TaxID=1921578 RepID=UPI001C5FB836|nr:hypothetical protein [Pseudonocardia nigra]